MYLGWSKIYFAFFKSYERENNKYEFLKVIILNFVKTKDFCTLHDEFSMLDEKKKKKAT